MTSTINPTVPASTQPLASAPVRDNFLAAYNDINALQGGLAATDAIVNPLPAQVSALETDVLALQNASATVPPRAAIGKLIGANLALTSDQPIPINHLTYGYDVVRIIATNVVGTPVAAQGGIYTATSKGGTAIVAASQSYTGLVSGTTIISLTLASTGVIRLNDTLYLSLTTPNSTACTADIYVYADVLGAI